MSTSFDSFNKLRLVAGVDEAVAYEGARRKFDFLFNPTYIYNPTTGVISFKFNIVVDALNKRLIRYIPINLWHLFRNLTWERYLLVLEYLDTNQQPVAREISFLPVELFSFLNIVTRYIQSSTGQEVIVPELQLEKINLRIVSDSGVPSCEQLIDEIFPEVELECVEGKNGAELSVLYESVIPILEFLSDPFPAFQKPHPATYHYRLYLYLYKHYDRLIDLPTLSFHVDTPDILISQIATLDPISDTYTIQNIDRAYDLIWDALISGRRDVEESLQLPTDLTKMVLGYKPFD